MKTDQIQKVHKDWYKLDLSAIVAGKIKAAIL